MGGISARAHGKRFAAETMGAKTLRLPGACCVPCLQQEVHATTAKVDVGDDSGGDDVDPAH
eukprot:6203782-Pleurochrysis_carterae.AAC.4